MITKCKCGSENLFVKVEGTRKGLYCGTCGKWLKWLNKEEFRVWEHKNEKTNADEMFKMLHYSEHFIHSDNEIYRIESSHCLGKSIIFQYNNKRLLVPSVLYMQELQAINKKCQELGWLEEER